eukprot:5870677-Alexandrium_andersonii.AAC.1
MFEDPREAGPFAIGQRGAPRGGVLHKGALGCGGAPVCNGCVWMYAVIAFRCVVVVVVDSGSAFNCWVEWVGRRG